MCVYVCVELCACFTCSWLPSSHFYLRKTINPYSRPLIYLTTLLAQRTCGWMHIHRYVCVCVCVCMCVWPRVSPCTCVLPSEYARIVNMLACPACVRVFLLAPE